MGAESAEVEAGAGADVIGMPAGTARAALVALAKDLAKALEKPDSSGHDWDD